MRRKKVNFFYVVIFVPPRQLYIFVINEKVEESGFGVGKGEIVFKDITLCFIIFFCERVGGASLWLCSAGEEKKGLA